MNCPKCGRVLYKGEVCPCSRLNIVKRDHEIRKQEETERLEREAELAKIEERKAQRKKEMEDAVKEIGDRIDNRSKEIEASYRSVFKSPITSISSFLKKRELKKQSIGIIGAFSFFYAVLITVLFQFTNASYFLGASNQVNKTSFFVMFFVAIILSAFSAIGSVFLPFKISEFYEGCHFYESVNTISIAKVLSAPLVLLGLIVGIFLPNFAIFLLAASGIIETIILFSFFDLKTQDKNVAFYATLIVSLLSLVSPWLLFVFIF